MSIIPGGNHEQFYWKARASRLKIREGNDLPEHEEHTIEKQDSRGGDQTNHILHRVYLNEKATLGGIFHSKQTE